MPSPFEYPAKWLGPKRFFALLKCKIRIEGPIPSQKGLFIASIPPSNSFSIFLLLTRFLQLKSWESRKLSKFWSIVTCTAKFAVSGMQNYDLICYAQKNVNYFSLKIIDKYNKLMVGCSGSATTRFVQNNNK